MSLWFTVRPFPYVELLRAVLDVIPTGKVVETDRFKQPGWPAITKEGRRGMLHPWLALSRPKLATGGMATKLPRRPWLQDSMCSSGMARAAARLAKRHRTREEATTELAPALSG